MLSSASSAFTLASGSRLLNMGYFQYDTDSTVSIQGKAELLFPPVTFRWGGPSQAEAAVVTSGEELREALSGPQTCIVCTGDLEVSGDLELSDRELHVAGTLTLEGGSLSVSGSRAVLEGKLDLGGGALTVSGGALVRAPEAQNVSSVCLEDGSLLVTESNLALAGGENSLSANSFLLAPGGLTLQNASLDVRQSQLRVSGGYSLQGQPPFGGTGKQRALCRLHLRSGRGKQRHKRGRHRSAEKQQCDAFPCGRMAERRRAELLHRFEAERHASQCGRDPVPGRCPPFRQAGE